MLFPAVASAQPGNEREVIQGQVKALQDRIAAASQQITNRPHDAPLYSARGALYIELYRALYEGYYNRFYGPKPPELEVAAIATKAIADLARAIEKSPSAELYYQRGEMYEARWSETVREMKYGV